MKRMTWLVLGIALVLAPAMAQAGEAEARAALAKLVPQGSVESLRPAADPGYFEAVVSGQVLYVSRDGAYVRTGDLWRTRDASNLSEVRRGEVRGEALARHGSAKRIVFPAAEQKHVVSVFTDFDCGYCQRLHAQIEQYNALGITVEYVLFPRGGPASPSFDRAVSVWCAADRKAAFTAAKLGTEPEHKVCPNPIGESFPLAERAGVKGTPTVFDAKGALVGTYLTPEQMLARLEGK